MSGRVALPALAAMVAAFVAGTGFLAWSEHESAAADLGRWGAISEAGSQPKARASADPFRKPAGSTQGAPSRVRVAAIGLDAGLEQLQLNADGALEPPHDFDRAGWYSAGTVPGDIGPAVIAGHVDSSAGPAVFYRLRELTVGDRIEVTRGSTVVRFAVTRTAWYPKTTFPTTQVYGPTPDRQLRLITCGGVFDHRLRSYQDNFVVYAVAG